MPEITHHEGDEGGEKNSLIIHLNEEQVPFLEQKREEYQNRVEKDPNNTDAQTKYIIINHLLIHGKVTLTDVSEELRNVFPVFSNATIKMTINAYGVVRAYNNVDMGSLTKGEPNEDVRDKVQMRSFFTNVLSEEPEPNEMTDTEQAIAKELPGVLRVDQNDTIKEISFPDRKALFLAIRSYIRSRIGIGFSKDPQGMKKLSDELLILTERLKHVRDASGNEIDQHEINKALTYLFFNGPRIV